MKRVFFIYIIIFLSLFASIDRNVMAIRVLNYYNHIPTMLVEASKGERELSPRQFREAIYYYKIFAKLVERNGDAYGMIALCYYYLGDHEKAVQYYHLATKEDSRAFAYYFNLAIIYAVLYEDDKAAAMYRKAFDLSPEEILKNPINENPQLYVFEPVFLFRYEYKK